MRIDERPTCRSTTSSFFFTSEDTAILSIRHAEDVVYAGRTNTQAVAVIECGR